jgi:hypothetical protein
MNIYHLATLQGGAPGYTDIEFRKNTWNIFINIFSYLISNAPAVFQALTYI